MASEPTPPADLETQIRQLLRSYKGVSAVVAVCYRTPGGKGKQLSYVVQTTGDDRCERLADMLVAATRTPTDDASYSQGEAEQDDD